jgi:hypothetical protein
MVLVSLARRALCQNKCKIIMNNVSQKTERKEDMLPMTELIVSHSQRSFGY